MTYWETPHLNRLNASVDAQGKTVNPVKYESGYFHTMASFGRHYAMSPNPS